MRRNTCDVFWCSSNYRYFTTRLRAVPPFPPVIVYRARKPALVSALATLTGGKTEEGLLADTRKHHMCPAACDFLYLSSAAFICLPILGPARELVSFSFVIEIKLSTCSLPCLKIRPFRFAKIYHKPFVFFTAIRRIRTKHCL